MIQLIVISWMLLHFSTLKTWHSNNYCLISYLPPYKNLYLEEIVWAEIQWFENNNSKSRKDRYMNCKVTLTGGTNKSTVSCFIAINCNIFFFFVILVHTFCVLFNLIDISNNLCIMTNFSWCIFCNLILILSYFGFPFCLCYLGVSWSKQRNVGHLRPSTGTICGRPGGGDDSMWCACKGDLLGKA